MNELKHKKLDIIIKSISAFLTLLVIGIGLIEYVNENDRLYREKKYDSHFKIYSNLLSSSGKMLSFPYDSIGKQNFTVLKQEFLTEYYGKISLLNDSVINSAATELKITVIRYSLKSITKTQFERVLNKFSLQCNKSLNRIKHEGL